MEDRRASHETAGPGPGPGRAQGPEQPDGGDRRALVLLGLGAAAGLALAAWSLVAPGEAADAPLPAGVVARVNGAPIRIEDYRRLVDGLERDMRGPIDEARRRHVLDRMIEEELLVQRAIALGLARLDRKVRGELTSSVIQSVVAAAEDRTPSESELREFYEENRAFFSMPPRLRARQVYLRRPPRGRAASEAETAAIRQRAEQARALLAGGEPFEVVRAGFGDDEISPIPDTLLPPAKLREYVGPSVTAAVLELEEGAFSEPLETSVGFHVLQLVEREPERIPDFETIVSQVAAEWRRRAGDAALRAYLAELRREADVSVTDDLP
ncbi:MAG: peptidylprolyl isomerase [Myxococcota bacterium]